MDNFRQALPHTLHFQLLSLLSPQVASPNRPALYKPHSDMHTNQTEQYNGYKQLVLNQ